VFTQLKQILLRVLTTRAAWPLLLSVGLLCLAGFLALEVVSPARADAQQRNLLLGLVVLLVALIPNVLTIGRFSYLLYGLALLTLVVVLFTTPINGARRWFMTPWGMQLQPSELAKIATILALGWYLRYRKDMTRWAGLIIPALLALVPAALILIEPDLGTALLFPPVLLAMLFAARIRVKYLLIVCMLALVLAPGLYPLLRPYQQQRVRSLFLQFADDAEHQRGAGYHLQQSKVTLGAGGVMGSGLEGADHIRHGILPEAYTDFIYAVVGSQFGFVGCVSVLLLYLGFAAAGMEIAVGTRDPYGRYVAVGLTFLIVSQALINIAMTVGLAPVVGIALPFVSYGGSSLMGSLLAVGLLLNISIRRR